MAIILKSRDEIAIMREAGRHVAEVLGMLAAEVRPGLVVAELDRLVRREFKQRRLIPTFLDYQPDRRFIPFPATVCVSINEQIVHGIPGSRELHDGDIVSLDLGATYRGYVGDSAITVGCGAISDEARRLIEVTEAALRVGIEHARPGLRLGDLGHAIQVCIENAGYGVVREFCGHGVGRRMHEEPDVSNHGTPGSGRQLKAGMVIAIEPMANLGTWQTARGRDGWTISTADGRLSAHFEHTVAVTPDGPEILTLP